MVPRLHDAKRVPPVARTRDIQRTIHDANRANYIGQVVYEKEHPNANSAPTSQNQLLMAPARLFWVDLALIISVTSVGWLCIKGDCWRQ